MTYTRGLVIRVAQVLAVLLFAGVILWVMDLPPRRAGVVWTVSMIVSVGTLHVVVGRFTLSWARRTGHGEKRPKRYTAPCQECNDEIVLFRGEGQGAEYRVCTRYESHHGKTRAEVGRLIADRRGKTRFA